MCYILKLFFKKKTTKMLLKSTVESCTQLQFNFKNSLSINCYLP